MFLTESEVRELTEYQLPAYQKRWLDQNGVPYFVGASGRPKVLRSALERGGTMQQSREPKLRLS